MATVTFVAQVPGTENAPITRSSGTMPYVAYTGGTWHKSFAAAFKASTDRYHGGTTVYPVVPVKFNGKPSDRWPETVTEGWGDIPAATMRALLADKLGLDAEIVTEQADVDAAEAILAEGTPTADGGLVLEAADAEGNPVAEVAPVAKAEPVTTFYVSRDTTDDRASDETRAMCHARIHVGTDLHAAQDALAEYLRNEAGFLTRGRDITKASDLWAFRRAVTLSEIAAEVREIDPRTNPHGYKVASRYADQLRFSIVAQTR